MRTSTKAEKVRALLADGATPGQIATFLGVTRKYVYSTRHAQRQREKKAAEQRAKIEAFRQEANANREAERQRVKVARFLPAPPRIYTLAERLRILFTGRL